MDLFHAVGPEQPEVLAKGLLPLLAALGKGGAEPGVGDAEGGFQGTEGQEGEPQVAAPAGGPEGVWAEARGHLMEEGLENVEEVIDGVEGAAAPDVGKRHGGAAAADLAEGEGLTIPGVAEGESPVGLLPEEFPEAGGEMGAPDVDELG